MSKEKFSVGQRRLSRFTPLRYPGGKGKLSIYVKKIILENGLSDGEYIEPYAGGAAIALELLIQEYVKRIYINDIDLAIHAFWHCVLNYTEDLCRLIRDTPIDMETWRTQKLIFSRPDMHSDIELGFATFFLNRTNRSGILNGGVIGGKDQTGPWKIDARFNIAELIFRIQSIARFRDKIYLSRLDALDFVERGVSIWRNSSLIYFDPPYYMKGRDLYYSYYKESDHLNLSQFINKKIDKQKWIVSYDNCAEVANLYAGKPHVIYAIGYSARSARVGTEIMFFDETLKIPQLAGTMGALEGLTTSKIA